MTTSLVALAPAVARGEGIAAADITIAAARITLPAPGITAAIVVRRKGVVVQAVLLGTVKLVTVGTNSIAELAAVQAQAILYTAINLLPREVFRCRV